MWGLGRALVILLVVVVAVAAAWIAAIRWHPATKTYPVQGVDVSEANGTVDWNTVAGAGADFAYAVATHGASGRDQRFEANWREIDAAGLRRGAIHIYSLCRLATDQADAFNTIVPRDPAALPAAVLIAYQPDCDARPDRAVLVGELKRFLTGVETHLGKPMLVKVSRGVERDYRLAEALPRSIWAIGNFFPPDYAARPWRMWQASDMRRIDGVEGPVNWDVAAP